MKNILCRHCYHLFRGDRLFVVCQSQRCSQIVDDRGRVGARFMDPRAVGLWRRFRRRLDLEAPCPYCEVKSKLLPACPRCRGVLERDVGDVEGRVLAVIGAPAAGKSHFLAAVLHELIEDGGGGHVWKVELNEQDEELYRRDYLEPFFEDQEELAGTRAEVRPELRLMIQNERSGQQMLLVFRDLGGENFLDPERLKELSFLRYAQGVVLMADPLAYEPPEDAELPWRSNGRVPAAKILETYRRVLEEHDRYPEQEDLPLLPSQKALAVAVTKADLVLPDGHPFWSDEPSQAHLEPGYWSRRRDDDRDVRAWIRRNLDRTLASVPGFDDVGFFFVSSYGYRHEPQTDLTQPPRPRRVHEPIFGLIDRLLSSTQGEGDEGF